MKKFLILAIAIAAVMAVIVFRKSGAPVSVEPEPVATTTASGSRSPGPVAPPAAQALPYGNATLEVGKEAAFQYVTLTVLDVTEDSRCPANANCIWAGTAKIDLKISGGSGNYTQTLELGKSLSTGSETVEFVSLTPEPIAGRQILDADYRIGLRVTLDKGIKAGGCFVGGCSQQLCSDQPNMASTCEWTASYACYKSAKCERQPNGQCGWTPSAELAMCLKDAR